MAKRGPNGAKLNGRPEFPMASNATGLDMGQRVVGPDRNSFRWRGRYFKGAMRDYRAGKRLAADLRQEACDDHGRAREIRDGYRNPDGTNLSGVTKVHDF